MLPYRRLLLLLAACVLLAASAPPRSPITVESPDGTLQIDLSLQDEQPHYSVVANGDTVVAPSPLGFTFAKAPPMRDNFEVIGSTERAVDTTWHPVWGTQDQIRNHYREQIIRFRETTGPQRRLNIIARAYNDGVAFRFEWPQQPGLDSLRIQSEDTHFRFPTDYTSWWIPDDYDGYEWRYKKTPLSSIRDSAAAISYNSYIEETDGAAPDSSSKTNRPGAVHTPLTLRSPTEDHYLTVHEADLTDYAGMTLRADPDTPTTLRSALVPWPSGLKVKASVPHQTPWRVVQVADSPGALIESKILANLNEPSKIEDPSWIEPMSYIGIWWGMHIRTYSWGQDGTHGATTERTKDYIDFAAAHDIDGVLVEGWNTGWENWGEPNAFNFTESYPDFDLSEVTRYANKQGVSLIGHHETGGDVPGYERQLEDAMALYDSVGVPAIKTGYAGMIRPEGQHHHGQWMVNHYRRVVKEAAEHEIALNVHEPIKPTGIWRTWPNMMTREGVRGMEYNAWAEPNPPEHTVTLPFTRMLAGPLDYTPGIFNLTPEEIQPDHRVLTTLAKQLANMVILYSPIQMASDLIEHYQGHEAVSFLEEVPTDWSESHVLNARIGEYITIARRENDGGSWFVGSTTNAEARTLDVPLSFLLEGRTYVAHIYEDGPEADYEDAPHKYRLRRGLVTSQDTLTAELARSGGQAVILEPASADEQASLSPLSSQ